MLIRIGEAHHATRAAGANHRVASQLQPLVIGIRRLHRQRLAVIHDQSDPGH